MPLSSNPNQLVRRAKLLFARMQGLRNQKGPIPYASPRGGWSPGKQMVMPPGFVSSEPNKGNKGSVPAAQMTPRGSISPHGQMGLPLFAQSPPTTPHQAMSAGSAQRSPNIPSQSLMAVMSPRYSRGLGYQSRTHLSLSPAGSRHQGMHFVMVSPSTSPAATSRPGRSYSLGNAASISPEPSISSCNSVQGGVSASLPAKNYTSRRSHSISDLRASVSSLSRTSSAGSHSPAPSIARGASPLKEQQKEQQRRPPPINQAVAAVITGEANQKRDSSSPMPKRSTMAFAGSPQPSPTARLAEGSRPSFELSTSEVEVRQSVVNGASDSGTVQVSLSTHSADPHHPHVSPPTHSEDPHHPHVSPPTRSEDPHHSHVSPSMHDEDPRHSLYQVSYPVPSSSHIHRLEMLHATIHILKALQSICACVCFGILRDDAEGEEMANNPKYLISNPWRPEILQPQTWGPLLLQS